MLGEKTLQKCYYDKKLSMVDTARVLNVTPATVAYWMRRHDFKRRSISEGVYVKQNPSGDPFNIRTQLTEKDKELLVVGLMLYWAEGSRRNKHVVQLANLDNRMLLLFLEFLRRICEVKEEKLTLNVQLYREFDKEMTRNYWSKELGIPKHLIAVNIHTDIRSKIKNQWSRYGIARIEVRNVKLKQWIDGALKEYLAQWI